MQMGQYTLSGCMGTDVLLNRSAQCRPILVFFFEVVVNIYSWQVKQ